MKFSSIESAIKSMQRGKFLVVVDDENRENEGDLIIAAEKATSSKINYMLRNARGLVCISLTESRLNELKLPQMVADNTEKTKCAFTVSVDAKYNTTTGISAFDRAETVKVLIDPKTKPEHLLRPGHMFPIKYQEGGVLVRPGHTEAGIDLCKLSGLYPSSVICEILNEDGTMAKLDSLFKFAEEHKLEIITINDLISYIKAKK